MSQSTPPTRLLEYQGTPPRNRQATLALVSGLLFFLFPFVPGYFAVKYGRQGVRRAAEVGVGGRRARVGIALGIVNDVLSVLFVLAAPVVIIRAREAAFESVRRVSCADNLRQIAMGVLMYVNENRGAALPSINELYDAGYGSDPKRFVCPSCSKDSTNRPVAVGSFGKTDYHVMLPMLPTPRFGYGIGQWMESVLAYEPLANHDGAGAHFLFHDGHVEWLDAAAAKRLIAKTLARRGAGEGP